MWCEVAIFIISCIIVEQEGICMRNVLLIAFFGAAVIGCSSETIVTSQAGGGIEGIWEEEFTLTFISAIGPMDQPPYEYDVDVLSSLHLQDGRFDLTVKPTSTETRQPTRITSGKYCVQGDTLCLVTGNSGSDCESTPHLFRFSRSAYHLKLCEEPRRVTDSIMEVSLFPLLWQYGDLWSVKYPPKRCGEFNLCQRN
jgi:hypothetical protein